MAHPFIDRFAERCRVARKSTSTVAGAPNVGAMKVGNVALVFIGTLSDAAVTVPEVGAVWSR
jgi:hypothetical protein